MLATFLHMMQGTPYIYQGEELGMTNVRFSSIDDYRDIETLNMYKERMENGEDPQAILEKIYYKGRDNARTPMQWDDSEHAGFTTGTPWIQVNPNYKEINAKAAMEDPNSVFHYYKKLIQLRKAHDVIVYGTYELILEDDPFIYAYTRTLGKETLVVMTNFSSETAIFRLPSDITYSTKQLLISNYDVDEQEELYEIRLRPWEARVYKLQ